MAGLARVVIKNERSVGVVKEWKGKFGWITPVVPINHVEAKKHDGRLYVALADLVGMQFLKQGARVDYMVYSDGTGLGAQQVKIAGATTHQAPKGLPLQKSGGLAPTAKFGQKPQPPVSKPGILTPSSKAKPQPPKGVIKTAFNKNTPQAAAKEPVRVPATPAKGAGKGAPVKQLGTFAKNNAASGKGSLQGGKDRKYLLNNQKAAGIVEKWFGQFGWIKPFNAVKHPMAEKHNGMLYCNKRDLVECETLQKGQKVEFFVYTDSNGIGCDKVKLKGGPPQQETARVPEKTVQKPGQPHQKPGQPQQKPGQPQQKPGQPQAQVKKAWQPLQKGQKPGQPQQKPGQPQVKKVWQPLQKGQKPGQPEQKPGQPQQKPGQPQQRPGQPQQASGKGKGKEANAKGKGKGGFQWSGGAAAAVREVQKTIEKPKFGNQAVAKAQAPKGPPPSNMKKTLPPNWQEQWSDEHQVPYFWNKVTKESKWVKPLK